MCVWTTGGVQALPEATMPQQTDRQNLFRAGDIVGAQHSGDFGLTAQPAYASPTAVTASNAPDHDLSAFLTGARYVQLMHKQESISIQMHLLSCQPVGKLGTAQAGANPTLAWIKCEVNTVYA